MNLFAKIFLTLFLIIDLVLGFLFYLLGDKIFTNHPFKVLAGEFLDFISENFTGNDSFEKVENETRDENSNKEVIVEDFDGEKEIKDSENVLLLDFSKDRILEIKGVVPTAVIVKTEDDSGELDLWLFDIENDKIENIGLGTSINRDFPIGLKGDFVFWLSQDKSSLFIFNLRDKELFKENVPVFNPAFGEQARIYHSETPWLVIIAEKDFRFFSKLTGEVFSDADLAVAELFRQKINLDNFLTKEELSNLGFIVE